jgi:hypothetical protein
VVANDPIRGPVLDLIIRGIAAARIHKQ